MRLASTPEARDRALVPKTRGPSSREMMPALGLFMAAQSMIEDLPQPVAAPKSPTVPGGIGPSAASILRSPRLGQSGASSPHAPWRRALSIASRSLMHFSC